MWYVLASLKFSKISPLCLPLFVFVFAYLRLCLYVYLSIPVSFCLHMSLHRCVFCFFVSLHLNVCVVIASLLSVPRVSRCVSKHPLMPLLCVFVSLCRCLYVPVSVHRYVFVSHLSFCVSVYLCLHLYCFCLAFLRLCVPAYVRLSVTLLPSLSARLCFCLDASRCVSATLLKLLQQEGSINTAANKAETQTRTLNPSANVISGEALGDEN